MLYLPLTKAVDYTANGVALQNKSFALLEPGCEFCVQHEGRARLVYGVYSDRLVR